MFLALEKYGKSLIAFRLAQPNLGPKTKDLCGAYYININ